MSGEKLNNIEQFQNELDSNPFSLSAINQLAQHFANRGDYASAIQYYEKLIRLDEENGKAWIALGHCYLLKGEYQKCFSAYQRSLYTLSDTRDPQLWYGIGLLYNKFDTHEYAEPAFQAVLRICPNFEQKQEILYKLGLIYQKTKQYDNALTYLQRSIDEVESVPTARKVDVLTNIGSCMELKGEINNAIEKYKEAIALDGSTNFKVHEYLGYAYYKEGRIEDAIVEFEKALELVQDNVAELGDIHYLLGLSYLKSENFTKSQQSFQNAIYKNPNSYVYWVSIGILYAQSTQPHDAFECFIKASNLYSEGFETCFNMAILYEQCKQKSEAILSYQRVYELNSEYTVALQRKQLLQSQGEIDPPPSFVHPTINITDTTFSINKSEKVQKQLPDIAKIKPQDKLAFTQDTNDTNVKIKLEPGITTQETSALPTKTIPPPQESLPKPQTQTGTTVVTSPLPPSLPPATSKPAANPLPEPPRAQQTMPPPVQTMQQPPPQMPQNPPQPIQTPPPQQPPPQQPPQMPPQQMPPQQMPPQMPQQGMTPQMNNPMQQMPPQQTPNMPPNMPPNMMGQQPRPQQYMRPPPQQMMQQPGQPQQMMPQQPHPGQHTAAPGQGMYPPQGMPQGMSPQQYMMMNQQPNPMMQQSPGMPPQMQPQMPQQMGMQMQQPGMQGMGMSPMGMNPQMMMMYNYQMMQAYMNSMRHQQQAMANQMGMQAQPKKEERTAKNTGIYKQESSENSDEDESDEDETYSRSRRGKGKHDRTRKFAKR